MMEAETVATGSESAFEAISASLTMKTVVISQATVENLTSKVIQEA